jgi:hypothetical protein
MVVGQQLSPAAAYALAHNEPLCSLPLFASRMKPNGLFCFHVDPALVISAAVLIISACLSMICWLMGRHNKKGKRIRASGEYWFLDMVDDR